jgi:hypothetical protein
MSLVAIVAHRFIQGRHADRYLGSKRVTILVSAKRPRMSQKYLRCNFTYVIICKACTSVWLFKTVADARPTLLDAAFEDFATSLVVSNIYYLVPANTIGFSHSIPVLKSQSASDLQATNISSRKPSSASSPHISQLCLKDPLRKGKSSQQL